jgi:hypothetical protein
MMMGWTISVGTAGVRGNKARSGGQQALSVYVDAQGVTAQVKVIPSAGTMPAWQAQRVWQNVLSALVDA